MTISSVELKQEGTSLSGSGDDQDGLKRNYTANYRVVTDDPTTSPKAIEAHFKATTSLPWYGRSWKWNGATNDSDSEAICKKLEISHRPKSGGVFDVEATFEPKDGSEPNKEKPSNSPDGELTDDPLGWREQLTITYTQITEPVMWARFMGFTTGVNGNDPYRGLNAMQIGALMCPQGSNLVPFNPLPEKEIDLKVIRMTKNVPNFDSNAADRWVSSVNTDLVDFSRPNLGIALKVFPLTGRLKQIGATSEFQNGRAFVRREIEIWVHPRGWRGRLADMGLLTKPLDPADAGFVSPGDILNRKPNRVEQTVPKDADDYPIGEPILLDGFGRPLRSNNPHRTIWSNWQYYDEKQWAGNVDKW